MNKQAHTPERWEAIGLTAIATAGTSGRIIANVTPPGDFATPQEVERIRALIAAAPELVEALNSACESLYGASHDLRRAGNASAAEYYMAAANAAQAALQKAGITL